MERETFTRSEIEKLDSMFRRHLMNSLPGLKPLHLAGTRSETGILNLGLFNSVVHIGANPAHMGFILRPTTVPRHTYNNLKKSGFFTLNPVPESAYKQAHQTSAKYPEEESEFAATGLEPEWIGDFPAPFVKGFPIQIGLKFAEEHKILNGTRLIVGAVEMVRIAEGLVQEDGFIDLEKANLIAGSNLDAYYSINLKARLPYARP